MNEQIRAHPIHSGAPWSWRQRSALRCIGCSCKGSIPSTGAAAHNNQSLQFQGTGHPLLVPMGTRHACGVHTHVPGNIHTQEIISKKQTFTKLLPSYDPENSNMQSILIENTHSLTINYAIYWVAIKIYPV